ncbi:ferric-chelate reductase [Beauveria brongniartii RCEF 3172]|uniref:Ferric-chelate reductase n=1 Tax=Beauveria brongniartii RCEF 3172 TaxID=1081107 RepID=A0A167AHK0_9HYPO|nr:ferric-chelate reductase [Beauveria brongniartii RCEF 3172]
MKLSCPGAVGGLMIPCAAQLGHCIDTSFNSTCAESCQNSLGPVIFADFLLHATLREQNCKSALSLTSTYLCIDLNCGASTRDMALARMNDTCQTLFNTTIPIFSRLSNYTHGEILNFPRIHRSDTLGPQEPRHGPVLPAPEYFSVWLQTLDGWSYSYHHHFLYGAAVLAFWVVVVAIGFLHRLYLVACRIYYSYPSLQLVKLPLGPSSWLKRRLLLPATFGYRCAQRTWGCSVPPRIQSITIFAFIAINTAYSVIGYQLTKESYYFDSVLDQALRYVSDRTGIIAFVNFPLIWLFGMRNNFAIWLTGWDFGTFNSFHRWTARIATIQAIVHSLGYSIIVHRQGGWQDLYAQLLEYAYWQAGVLPVIRRYHYEAFLVMHIGLSVLLLFSMLGHVSIFNGRWNGFVRVPTYIWIFDRVMRVLRSAAFSPLSWGSKARASYSQAADIVQVSVPVEWYSLRKPKPGTFFYLTVLSDVKSRLQSHPFTVAAVVTRPPVQAEERTALLAPTHRDEENGKTQTSIGSSSIEFLIRPYNGFTAQLRELALDTKQFKVLVEGPYGTSHPLHTYNHVVFIVGGTGIVTPISYMSRFIGNSKRKPVVDLHWAVREPAFANMVLEHYLGEALRADNIEVTLHASRSIDLQPVFSESVSQRMGRPAIPAIIAAAATAAGRGRLAVVACGPEGILDDARLGVCCGNDSYCFVSTGGESRCCPLGSNCVADSPCNSKSYYCTRTATTTALSLPSVAGNATETGCCGRRCPQPQYFLCPAELGGNCCPYGAECRADGSCVGPVTLTTTTTTTLITSTILPTAQCRSGACATSTVGGGGLSPTTKAGIAVTVVASTGVVVGALTWLWLLRKKRAKARAAARAISVSEVPGDGVGEPRGYFDGAAVAALGAARAVPSQPNTPGDITSPVEIDSAVPEDDAVEMGGAPTVENVEMYELEATEVGRDTSSDEGTSEKEVAV